MHNIRRNQIDRYPVTGVYGQYARAELKHAGFNADVPVRRVRMGQRPRGKQDDEGQKDYKDPPSPLFKEFQD